jgi:hypothetical protein
MLNIIFVLELEIVNCNDTRIQSLVWHQRNLVCVQKLCKSVAEIRFAEKHALIGMVHDPIAHRPTIRSVVVWHRLLELELMPHVPINVSL